MIDLIEEYRPQIAVICRTNGVRRLELFGSAARGEFDPARSDLDFFVEFEGHAVSELSRQYFGLLFGLEDLLHRSIDLIRISPASDRRFVSVARQHVETIYDAGSSQAA